MPRFIGPGCMTKTSGLQRANRSGVRPKNRVNSRTEGNWLLLMRSNCTRSMLITSTSPMTESKSCTTRAPSFSNDAGNKRRRADQNHLCAKLGQRPQIRAGDAAVGDVADDRDPQPRDFSESFANRVKIEQPLRRMLVRAVAGVDDAATDRARQQRGGPRRRVADHDHVDAHRLNVAGGVDQRFALADAAPLLGEIDDVGRQTRRGEGKARARSRAVFEEGVDHDSAAQGGDLFHAARGDFLERIGGVEDEFDFGRAQFLKCDEVFSVPAMGGSVAHGVPLWAGSTTISSTPSTSLSRTFTR